MAYESNAMFPRWRVARSPIRRRRVATGSMLVLLLAAVAFAQTPAGKRAGRSAGLYAPSEPYTELAFVDPAAVAAATEGSRPVGSHVTVSFSVRSMEHSDTLQPWVITSSGGTKVAGAIRLAPGERIVVHQRILTGCAAPLSTVHHGGSPSASPLRLPVGGPARPGRPGRSPSPTARRGPSRVRITIDVNRGAESIGYWAVCGD